MGGDSRCCSGRSSLQCLGILCGGVISGIGFGISSTLGLFLRPISDTQGFGRGVLSMAIAVAMLLNGVTSIAWGALNDRYGPLVTCCSGTLLVFASLFLSSYARTAPEFMATIPFEGAAGGAISFGVTLGAVARMFREDDAREMARRSRAMGLTSSLSSLGVVVVPPIVQALLHAHGGGSGWRPAMRLVALGTLVMVPMAVVLSRVASGAARANDSRKAETGAGAKAEAEAVRERMPASLREPANAGAQTQSSGGVEGAIAVATLKEESDDTLPPAEEPPHASDAESPDLRQTLLAARAHPSYILLVVGFFVCGFHVIFVSTHLPAYCEDNGLPSWVGATSLSIIGIGNVLGTFCAGTLGARYPRSKNKLLSALYVTRSFMFAAFVTLPLHTVGVLAFAFLLGLLWLSTVPLTSGLVSDMFGAKYGSTLFGIAFCSHQLGSFFGAWLGGYIYDKTQSYDLMWWLEVAAGLIAGLIHWPISNMRVRAVPRRRESLAPVAMRGLSTVLDHTAATKAISQVSVLSSVEPKHHRKLKQANDNCAISSDE